MNNKNCIKNITLFLALSTPDLICIIVLQSHHWNVLWKRVFCTLDSNCRFFTFYLFVPTGTVPVLLSSGPRVLGIVWPILRLRQARRVHLHWARGLKKHVHSECRHRHRIRDRTRVSSQSAAATYRFNIIIIIILVGWYRHGSISHTTSVCRCRQNLVW